MAGLWPIPTRGAPSTNTMCQSSSASTVPPSTPAQKLLSAARAAASKTYRGVPSLWRVLVADGLAELEAAGFVRLRGDFPVEAAEHMRALVWRALGADSTVMADDRATWPTGRLGKSAARGLKQHKAFRAFWAPEVVEHLDALLGVDQWQRPGNAGDILLTFPEDGASPRQLGPFHSDFAMDVPDHPLFAVKIFAFLADVRSHMGGTMVIRNSHRLVRGYLDALPAGFPRNRAARQFRADHPWLGVSGTAPIGTVHHEDGLELEVQELTGAPGDVVITHPWTLHTGASNVGTSPRMMRGHRVFRR